MLRVLLILLVVCFYGCTPSVVEQEGVVEKETLLLETLQPSDLKGVVPLEASTDVGKQSLERPQAQGGSSYGLNGWDIVLTHAKNLKQSDLGIYSEKGYPYKIANWEKAGGQITFQIQTLSPTCTFTYPRQLRPLLLKRNDLTGPGDPDLKKMEE